MSEIDVLTLVEKGGIIALLLIAVYYLNKEKSAILKELKINIDALKESNEKVIEKVSEEIVKLRTDITNNNITINSNIENLIKEMKRMNDITQTSNSFLIEQNKHFMNIITSKGIDNEQL